MPDTQHNNNIWTNLRHSYRHTAAWMEEKTLSCVFKFINLSLMQTLHSQPRHTKILMSFLQQQEPLVPAECAGTAQRAPHTNHSHLLQGAFILISGEGWGPDGHSHPKGSQGCLVLEDMKNMIHGLWTEQWPICTSW